MRKKIAGFETNLLEARRLLSASPISAVSIDTYTQTVTIGSYVYFRGSDASGIGSELWRTDGTAAGTKLVHDSDPGSSSGLPTPLGAIGNFLIYTARSGSTTGIWKTDGTAAGTTFVSSFTGSPNEGVSVGSAVYIGCASGIVRTDGTAAGTVLVSGVATNISELEVVGTDVYGVAFQARIWRVAASSPTTATQVFSSSSISQLTSFSSKLYFKNKPTGGVSEIWSWSPSNTAGTRVAYTFGTNSINPDIRGVFGGKLYYTADSNGYLSLSRIYSSNSSETIFATDAPYAMFYGIAGTASGSVVFGTDEYSAARLYRSNEAQYYCEPIPFAPSTIDSVDRFTSVGDTVYFSAYNTARAGSDMFRVTQTSTSAVPIGEVAIRGGHFVANGKFVFTGAHSTSSTSQSQTFVDRTDRASISGLLWQDRDANGAAGSNDPLLTGRTVYLDSDNDGTLDAGEPQTVANALGRYSFFDLVAGTYRVRQVLPAGWTPVTPTTNLITVNAVAGTAHAFMDFTSRVANSGVITGTAFEDYNRDGIKNGIDRFVPTASARTIYSDTNNNGALDAGEPSTTTGTNGVFALNDVPAGTIRLRQVLAAGWVQSTPAVSPHVLTLADKQTASGITFGADPPQASFTLLGRVFLDPNHFLTYQNASITPPLAGQSVYIDANSNNVFDTGERTAITDSTGLYSFSGLDYGAYLVRPTTLAPNHRLGPQVSASLYASTPAASPLNLPIFLYLQLQQAAFNVDTRKVTLQFDNIPRISSTSGFTLTNLDTGVVTPGSALTSSYDSTFPIPALVLTLPTSLTLPDGRYRLTAAASAVTSYYGNDPMASSLSVEFHILAGDVNRDRIVGFDDLLIVAQNYGLTGKTFSQGNINYSADGKVDFDDLLMIAQRYGTSLVLTNAGTAAVRRSAKEETGGFAAELI